MEEQQHRATWRMEQARDLTGMEYLLLLQSKSTTQNGVSGIKLHYHQFAGLKEKLGFVTGFRGLSSAEILPRLFPAAKYLWLTRRDKARQAISFAIASATDRWWEIEGSSPMGLEAPKDPHFDAASIANHEQELAHNDQGWASYFEKQGIHPLTVAYEDLAADYSGTIRKVLEWLQIKDADTLPIPPPRLRRQAEDRKEEWLLRYLDYKKGNTESDTPAGKADAKRPSDHAKHPLLNNVPDAWKQWVVHSKLSNWEDAAILRVLADNGYSQTSAATELQKASKHPYFLGSLRAHRPARKSAAFSRIQARLAQLNSQARVVERKSSLSRGDFLDRYYSANRPVILRGLMTDWDALVKWTPEYLKSVLGDHAVEVMAGREGEPAFQRNGNNHRTEVRFSDFIDLLYRRKSTNDCSIVAGNRLLQQPVARPLWEDFKVFPEYLQPAASLTGSFLWLEPSGSVTPLHHERGNVLFGQVAGRKLFRLIPANESDLVYNIHGVYSDVDCERPDLRRFPKFRKATVIDVVLEPGEVLFMPVGWWHFVKALDVSMTLSFTNFVYPNHFKWE